MNSIYEYFSQSYLFDKLPRQDNNLLIGLAIFFLALIIAGIIYSIILDKKVKNIPPYAILKRHIINCSLTIGIIGLILVFFRWQEVLYFSAPILTIILLLAFLIWLVYIIIYIRKKLLNEIEKFYTEKRYQAYLPNKKRKNKFIN